MSLAIDVHRVTDVLLADGWHHVLDGSFSLDAYEYMHEKECVLKGGNVEGVPSTGAIWTAPSGEFIACPLTSILAVKGREPKKAK